jgi:hypothetical protein
MIQAIVNARALLIGFVALTLAAGLALSGSGGAVGAGSATAQLLYKFGSLQTPVKVIAKSI